MNHYMRALLIFAAVLLVSFGAVRGENEFVTERARAHYEPARAIDILHLKLEPQIDMPAGRITGAVTLTAVPLTNSLTRFTLHAVDMDVFSVTLNDADELPYQTDDTAVHVTLDHPYTTADTFTVRITYEAYPRMGLYFVRPSDDYPANPWQVWSQGEMIENRHWFPGWDYPNDRFTSEMIITVPQGMVAISNGALVDSATTDGATTFHWRESVPHVNYLISVVVGEYVETTDEWDGIPLSYFTLLEDSKYAELCFGKTPEMMGFFFEITGVRYPYEKYAQTVVNEFTWGGMENISATTLSRRTIHDERAHQDYQSDALVAHELAHQWFGDLVSFRSWDHAWLSEGFADYFETLYL
ncbi:MAG TPA: M1 family metallopeptidase, partial [candidate division Zixibacteria bacterium]|nr:M1 family metallopeptidase [candidate division Zixibacteria bacterium]